MFVGKAALRPVPPYAVVSEHAVESVDEALDRDHEALQEWLDERYQDFEKRQPVLGDWVSERISECELELAQSLGYFLCIVIYEIFREAFPTRLYEVDEDALELTLQTLDIDEAVRAADPSRSLATDDVVALGQPAIVVLLQHHLREAIEQLDDESRNGELEDIYRVILALVVALSHAVESPTGERGPAAHTLA